ncbi:MAG: bifunctional nuclease family protein [Bdellovibrionales bacterium]|nr:bifunctional nuclease family protein [Bdellovibrionales bacterium]
MKEKFVEIFPYGMTFSPIQNRPMMLFKDKSEQKVLPVWLSPLDAGITIQQNAVEMGYSSSPYSLTWKILKPLGVYLEKCVFTKVVGHHQYLDLHFKGHPKLQKLSCRADEAISFCLSNDTQFFCESDFFDKCRIVDSEMSSMGKDLKKHPHRFKNKHPYLN